MASENKYSQWHGERILPGIDAETDAREHELNAVFVRPIQAASKVVAAKMALFSSMGKKGLYR